MPETCSIYRGNSNVCWKFERKRIRFRLENTIRMDLMEIFCEDTKQRVIKMM
jgi:hypothetical protein